MTETPKRYYYQEYNNRYRRDFRKTIVPDKGYMGIIEVCPKCGKKGYGMIRGTMNTKTGTVHNTEWLYVSHHHKEHGKTVYDGYCYIGTLPI